MKQIGLYLVIFGVGSLALNLFGYEFSILMWLDTWGETVGMGIRIGAAVVGAVLWFLGNKAQTEQAQSEQTQAEQAQE
jgi:hypothetical protein